MMLLPGSPSARLIVLAACAVGALSTIGAALPYPVLPPLFAGDAVSSLNSFLGLPAKLLYSVAVAINPAGLVLGSVLLGPLSDRYGRRHILLWTTSAAALGHLATAYALVAGHYPLFILARFGTGLAEGNASVARALLADELDGEARARAFASFNGALYSGWLIGPLIAGLLVPLGVAMPFIAASGMLAATGVTAAMAFRAAPSSHRDGNFWEIVLRRNSFALLADRKLRRLFYSHFAYCLGVTAFYEFYPVWLVEFAGFGTTGIAICTALLCCVMTGTSIWLGRGFGPEAVPRYLRRYAFGTAFMVLATPLLGPVTGLIPLVLFGAPNALFTSVLPVYASERFGHLGQGGVMGLIATTFCLGNIVTALAGGGITLIDTRLILILGAAATGWAAWRFGREDQRIDITEPVPATQ